MPPGRSRAAAHRWVVILAGGRGERLARLTEKVHGLAVPKQYCTLFGGRSLLADAVARAGRLVDRSRILLVVAREHERYWRRELRPGLVGELLVQPRDRGTAVGALLPLHGILAADPEAVVTLMPSDHFVGKELVLARALRRAQCHAARDRRRLVLVGITPEAADPDYGWILPAEAEGRIRRLRGFVEKPSATVAADLMRQGGLWNAFLVTGAASAFAELFDRRLPEVGEQVRRSPCRSRSDLERLFAALPKVDFSRHVLQGAEEHLLVCAAPTCGWTDLGTPPRVAACVQRAGDRLVARAGSLAFGVGVETNGRGSGTSANQATSALDFPRGGAILPAPGYPVV